MLGRREILKLYGGALLAPAVLAASPAAAQGGPILRFGLITDPQYAPVPPRRTRFYANSLAKLSQAVETLNQEQLAFCVTLGDIIDRHWESYSHILPVYDRLAHPHHFVLGNHDFEVAADYLGSVLRVAGLERAYYSFKGAGWRFIVIDGNDVSPFSSPKGNPKQVQAQAILEKLVAEKAVNAQTWNGGMGDEQFAWLTAELDAADAANERVVIFGHYPVYPENEHNMWDHGRFVDLVTRRKSVAAFMNGHNHMGNYGEKGGKHFINFKGMVETADTTAYAIVELFADRLVIKGYGREESRDLRI